MAKKLTPWQQKLARLHKAPRAELIARVHLDPEPQAALVKAQEALALTENQARSRWFLAEPGQNMNTPEGRASMEKFMDEAPEVIALREVVAKAQAAADDATMFLLFRSLDPQDYEAAQAPFLREDGSINMEEFAPELVSLCHVHVEPGPRDEDGEATWIESEGMSAEEAREFLNSPGINGGDREAIIGTAYRVNATTRVGYADLGKGSRPTRA